MLKSELAGYMEIFHCGEQYAAVSRELETAFGMKAYEQTISQAHTQAEASAPQRTQAMSCQSM